MTHRAEVLSDLLRDRLGVRAGDGFEAKLAKAGRRLPRWARRDGRAIVEAIALETHPKLAPRIDRKRVDRALRNLTKHLEAIDPSQRRKEKILDLLAALSVVFIATAGLIITVMVWRGMI